MNKLSLSLLVALPCFVACAGQSYRLDVGPFFATGSGDIALQNAAGNLQLGQNQNDIDTNMGLGDTEGAPYIRLQADKDLHRVRLHGFGLESEGRGTLSGDFGDLVSGSQVTTTMQFYGIAANWGYQLARGDWYRIAGGVQAGYYSLDVAARSTLGREEVETDVLVPMPFVEVEGLFGRFTVGFNGALMSARLRDASGRYLDVEGFARLSLSDNFGLFGGYRYIVLDAYGEATGRDFDADVDMQGFFVGAGVRF